MNSDCICQGPSVAGGVGPLAPWALLPWTQGQAVGGFMFIRLTAWEKWINFFKISSYQSWNRQPKSFNVHVLSCFSCVQLCLTPWTVAHQAPLSMGFSRHEYWSGLSFPSSADLSTQGLNPLLLCLLHWKAGSLPLVPTASPLNHSITIKKLNF